MLPDRVSNPGPLTYESGALQIALRGPVEFNVNFCQTFQFMSVFQVCTVVRRRKQTPANNTVLRHSRNTTMTMIF